jgi:hypothetical protein
MSNMAAPDAAAPAADIAATAHVHDLEPAMAATLTPIRAILAAVDAYDGERVRVGGWVRTGRVQCGGTMAFLAVNDGSCHATLQLVVDAAQVALPPLARLAATGTSVLVSGVLRIPIKRSKERIEESGEWSPEEKVRERDECTDRRWRFVWRFEWRWRGGDSPLTSGGHQGGVLLFCSVPRRGHGAELRPLLGAGGGRR